MLQIKPSAIGGQTTWASVRNRTPRSGFDELRPKGIPPLEEHPGEMQEGACGMPPLHMNPVTVSDVALPREGLGMSDNANQEASSRRH